MTIKSKWNAVPVAAKWTVASVTAIMAAVGYLTTFQTDAEAQQAHDGLKQEVTQTKISLEQAYRNDRIDRHEREIFKWEDEIDDLNVTDQEYQKEHDKYIRRIDKLNATIECIREETC